MTNPAATVPAIEPGRLASALPRRRHLAMACAVALAPVALLRLGVGGEGIVGVLFLAVLAVLALKDLEERRIPNVIVLPATAGMLLAVAVLRPHRLPEAIVTGVAAGAFFLLPGLFTKGAVGMGDVKLALLLGVTLGRGVALALLLGCAAASVAGLVLIARHGSAARKTALPFAPFLAFGAVAALALGAYHAL